MKSLYFKKSITSLTCALLVLLSVIFVAGCDNGNTQLAVNSDASASTALEKDVKSLGEGKTKFGFEVTDNNGNISYYEINTDKTTVGDALTELNLIAGDEGEFGLYVKTVNGITLDYDKDGKYWAFYADGKYASSGVDMTDIKDGVTYAFKAE